MSDRHDDYPFDLVQKDFSERPEEARNLLRRRPFVRFLDTLEEGANHFAPGDRLEDAVNTALAVGSPLLMTGQAGTGKTQAAYWAARRLGLGEVLHFQVKSTSTARDLLYTFDTVRYFHDANLPGAELASRRRYLEPGLLWRAIDPGVDDDGDEDSTRRTAAPSGPRLLLIDEIDKAPRDFPNDLLHELNQMRFTVPEVPELGEVRQNDKGLRPVVMITSNNERQLPEPFLRRCVYHHIVLDADLVQRAVAARRGELEALSDEFLDLALRRFLDLRALHLRKPPSTGEYLVWLRVLALRVSGAPEKLQGDLAHLPYLSVLIKNRQDLQRLGAAEDV